MLDAEIVLDVNDRALLMQNTSPRGEGEGSKLQPPNVEVTGWTSDPAPIELKPHRSQRWKTHLQKMMRLTICRFNF